MKMIEVASTESSMIERDANKKAYRQLLFMVIT